jgi:hypothetical protein
LMFVKAALDIRSEHANVFLELLLGVGNVLHELRLDCVNL